MVIYHLLFFLDIVKHRPVCPVDFRPVVGDVKLPGDRGVDVPQPLADLLLRDPEFVGQRRPGVARPVEGQPLDVQLLGYCANRFLDPVVEGLVGRRLLGETENVIRAGVAGDDLCSFRLDEDRHRVDVLAGGLHPHEVGPAVAQPVEVEQIHQVHAAHVERQQEEIPGRSTERVGRLVGEQPLELLFGERLLVLA